MDLLAPPSLATSARINVYWRALVISATYVVVALLWIKYSDAALESLATNTTQLTELQTYKGWAFVAVTGVLLFFMTSFGYREIALREEQYRMLVATLEKHVELRTRELSQAIDSLRCAQADLIQSEKLAALGKLVAGVAHELNTPVGNCVTTASALDHYAAELLVQVERGDLRRSSLLEFMDQLHAGVELLLRNLNKAADLVQVFKQVAVDRTSDRRRHFNLAEVVREVILVLSPMLKDKPYRIVSQIPEEIELDSYPGALGQVVVNLINNAVEHGFEGRDHGEVVISAEAGAEHMVSLIATDDGKGIPTESLGQIFDPFFTTRLGHGGSGLGLHITHNLVTAVLGGKISVSSAPGMGARFILALPLAAPQSE